MERRYFDRDVETMSREAFLHYQWVKLSEQVRYAWEKTPFYKTKFEDRGITPDDIKSRQDFIEKVPFTTKHDLIVDQQEHLPYGRRLAIPEQDIFLTCTTSGTTGKGQEVHCFTRRDLERYSSSHSMGYYWAGCDPGDAVMATMPMSMPSAGWVHLWALHGLKCNVFSLAMYDTKTKLEYMKRFRIRHFFATPVYLEALTAEAKELGFDPENDFQVDSILIAGLPYPLSFVDRMERTWGTKIYDLYGCTQQAVGFTCENGALVEGRRGYYHMQGHISFVEVVDHDDGTPVAPGEIGEVVVTPLNNQASPLLRFRTGDRVRYLGNGACDCGRPFDLIEAGTIARYDNMLKIRAMNVWPEAVDEIVIGREGVLEYQGRVYVSDRGREEAEISIEFKKGISSEGKLQLIEQIGSELKNHLGIRIAVREAEKSLPRFDLKVRRWTDERAANLV